MSELGDDARGFLASARRAHDAPAGAKERVRAGLTATLAVSASARSTSAKGIALAGAKVAVVVALLGGGAFLLGHGKKASAPVLAPTPEPIAAVAPAVAPPIAPAEPTTPSAPVDALPAPRALPAPAATHATREPESDGSVAAEVALLRKVSASLRAGDPKGALAGVDEHARRFPAGALAEERDMERIVALCALGRRDEAARATERFSRAYPSSSHAARIRAACAAPPPSGVAP